MPVLALLLASTGPVLASEAPGGAVRFRVLLLEDSDPIRSDSLRLDQAFRAALVERSDRPVDLLREWLGAGKGSFFESPSERLKFLRGKYRRFAVDLVVSLDETGFDFARRYRSELWPSAPLVFCGISDLAARMRTRPPRSAGVALADDVADTIELALALQPAARRLVIVSGVGDNGDGIRTRVREALARERRRVEPESLAAEPVTDLLGSLRQLPPEAIVLYTLTDRDAAGLGQRSRDLVQRVSEASAAPVYGLRESGVGQGIVAAVASSVEEHGREAASLALTVLGGQDPDSLPLTNTKPVARADWLQLRRLDLDEARLPADADLRNVRPGLWQSYRRQVILAAAATTVLIAVILALLLWRAERRAAEDKLRKRLAFERLLSEISASVMDASPDAPREEIERPLERVVDHMGLERCGLFQVRPGQTHATVSHAASARGARLLDRSFGGEILPRLNEALREGESVELRGEGPRPWADFAGRRDSVSVLVPVSRVGDGVSGIFYQTSPKNPTLPADMTSRMLLVGQILLSAVSRRGAETSLKSSEEKYRTVVDSQSDLICRYLPDTTLTFVNESYCRYFGMAREELIGRRFLDLLPERSRRAVRRHVQSLMEDPRVEVDEQEVQRPDGSSAWLRWTEHAIFGPDGRILEFQAIGRDITDRKRAQEAEMRLANAARLTVLGELATSIAHEIRQPLGAILSNAEAAEILLESGIRDEEKLNEVREILSDIHREDLRASAVIQQVRSLMQQRPTEREPLGVNGVVRDVVMFVSPDARDRRVSIELDLADSLPLVYGDRVELQQVLLNLVVNGMDAMAQTPEGLRTLRIRTLAREGQVVIDVKDSGDGISPEVISRLFQSFVTTRRDGLGLGLSLSRSIIESHGGRITGENNRNRGATFRCVLPVLSEPRAVTSAPGRTA